MAAGASTRFAGPGVIFSIVALILFALMTMATDIALESTGWVQVYPRRADRERRDRHRDGHRALDRRDALRPPPDGRPGLVEPAGRRPPSSSPASSTSLGLISFAVGLESAPTWMVGLAASFGPAVTIVVAVALLGERLARAPVGRPRGRSAPG